MKRTAAAAAVIMLLSCAVPPGPSVRTGVEGEAPDPSRDRYLSETFLDDRKPGGRMEAGVDISGSSDETPASKEAFLRFERGMIRLTARARERAGIDRAVFHISAAPHRSVRIDLADLVPDLGIGLVSSSRRFAYPFSSHHPLYRPKGVRGWTGFYGSFIRGVALRALSGRLEFTIVSGMKGVHADDGIDFEERTTVAGARMGLRSGRAAGGITVLGNGSSSGKTISGFDLSLRSGTSTVMIESALSEGGSRSAVWGVSAGAPGFRYGIIGWTVPRFSEGYLAACPGLSGSSRGTRSGMSIVVLLRPTRRFSVSMWGERRRIDDGERSKTTFSARFETRVCWRDGGFRIALSSRANSTSVIVPWPPDAGDDKYKSLTTLMTLFWKVPEGASVTLEARRPGGDAGTGTIVTLRGSVDLPRGLAALYGCCAIYSASEGNPRFSLYEPSPAGKYPWKSVYGSGKRLKIGLEWRTGPFRTSLWALWTGHGPSEAGIRLAASI